MEDLGKLQQQNIDYTHYEKVKRQLADLEQEKRELWNNSEKLFPEIQEILEAKIQKANEARNWYNERNEILSNPNWINVSDKDKIIIQFLVSQLAQKLYSERDESLVELRSILLKYS